MFWDELFCDFDGYTGNEGYALYYLNTPFLTLYLAKGTSDVPPDHWGVGIVKSSFTTVVSLFDGSLTVEQAQKKGIEILHIYFSNIASDLSSQVYTSTWHT